MAKTILFISPAAVKAITNIDDSVDEKILSSTIREAQEQGIRQVFGDALYAKEKELIASGFTSDDEAYRTLLDESRYYLANLTVCLLIPRISAKISNVGLYTTNDENVNSMSLTEVFEMKDYYRNMSDQDKYRLQQYLLKNKDSFPELDETCCCRLRANLYSAASCNLFLGGARGFKGFRRRF